MRHINTVVPDVLRALAVDGGGATMSRPPKSHFYGSVSKGRGLEIRAERSEFRGKPRFDIRVYYEFRPGDPDSARPTKKGINIPVRDLPALQALIGKAVAECLTAGLLELEDWEHVGLEPPVETEGGGDG